MFQIDSEVTPHTPNRPAPMSPGSEAADGRKSISGGPRLVALHILCRVESGAYADRLLEAGRQRDRLPLADRNLVHELVQGTITWQAAIDHLLTPYLGKRLKHQTPELRNLMRLTVYQLRYLDRIPGYAAVSEAVAIARSLGGSGAAKFINAVLRGVSEDRRPAKMPDPSVDPDAHLALSTSHPVWLIRRWRARYGREACRQLCDHNNARPLLTIRANATRTTAQDLRHGLERQGVIVDPSPVLDGYLDVRDAGPLFETQSYHNGLFFVQSPGAGLVVQLLDPVPGDTVLDVCSAPGGKAVVASERVGERGHVVALDLRPGRLRTLRKSVDRLGHHNIAPVAADILQAPISAQFSRVLVDAPCSSLGILSRHPELKWRRTEPDIARLAGGQLRLMAAAARRVRPGGTLVYSTCTTEPEENEGVVEAFLAAQPEFRLQPAGRFLETGVTGPYLHVLPHVSGVDGAFAARFERR